MPDGVGSYIYFCTTTHSLQEDSAFWDVARSVKAQLSQIDIAQQLVEESQLLQSTMANLTDATAFAEAARSQHACQLDVTNLSRRLLRKHRCEWQALNGGSAAVNSGSIE
jgi:hypothetical protein